MPDFLLLSTYCSWLQATFVGTDTDTITCVGGKEAEIYRFYVNQLTKYQKRNIKDIKDVYRNYMGYQKTIYGSDLIA